MPSSKRKPTKATQADERIITLVQDLFILEALKGGIKVEAVRKILKVDKWRVTKISKALKEATPKPG